MNNLKIPLSVYLVAFITAFLALIGEHQQEVWFLVGNGSEYITPLSNFWLMFRSLLIGTTIYWLASCLLLLLNRRIFKERYLSLNLFISPILFTVILALFAQSSIFRSLFAFAHISTSQDFIGSLAFLIGSFVLMFIIALVFKLLSGCPIHIQKILTLISIVLFLVALRVPFRWANSADVRFLFGPLSGSRCPILFSQFVGENDDDATGYFQRVLQDRHAWEHRCKEKPEELLNVTINLRVTPLLGVSDSYKKEKELLYRSMLDKFIASIP